MSDEPIASPTIREAGESDLLAVMRVLDGALLDVTAADVRERLADRGVSDGDISDSSISSGDVFVSRGGVLVSEVGGHVVGALVLDGNRIEAVAVRRPYRRQGIGTALVAAAATRTGRLTATFDPRVRSFYESLGFEVRTRDGRLYGMRPSDPTHECGGDHRD